MKKYSQKQRLLHHQNLFIYRTLTAIACSLICFSPFWFPLLLSSMKAFLFVSLPKAGLVLFIVGNLIVVVLVGESKLFAPNSASSSDVYYDEYISNSQTVQNYSISEEKKKEGKMEKMVKKRWVDQEKIEIEKEGDELIFHAEELSKRADDFIAKVNMKRRLEG